MWSEDRVFYEYNSRDESWFEVGGGETAWQIYIDNPTQVDYDNSGTDKRLRLYIYDASGNQLDESSKYFNKYTLTDGGLIINQSGGTNLVWNSTDVYFWVTVPADSTVAVNSCFAGGATSLFNDAVDSEINGGSIRIVKPDGALFYATLRGQCRSHWRIDEGATSGDFSSEWLMEAFGY